MVRDIAFYVRVGREAKRQILPRGRLTVNLHPNRLLHIYVLTVRIGRLYSSLWIADWYRGDIRPQVRHLCQALRKEYKASR